MKENLKPQLKVLRNSGKSLCFPVILSLSLMNSFEKKIIFVTNENVIGGSWIDRNTVVSAASRLGVVRYPVQCRAGVGHFY